MTAPLAASRTTHGSMCPSCCPLQRRGDVGRHSVGRRHGRVPELPEPAVGGRRGQRVVVVAGQRLQADAAPFEHGRSHVDHAGNATRKTRASGRANCPERECRWCFAGWQPGRNGSSSAPCPRPTAPLAVAWWAVLLLRGVAARGVRHRDGRPRRRRRARRSARRPADVRRRRLRPAAGAQPDPPGAQRQPRRSHRGLAVRPADRGVRAPARHGPPRGSRAHQRPHRRARLRPRDDRSAAVHLDGLHRDRHRRDGRRSRVAR